MIQNLFILSSTGEVLIEKQWTGLGVKRHICELFWEEVSRNSDPTEVLPVIATPKCYMINVYRCNMFFLSTVQRETSPLLVLETLHRIVDVFIQYFSKLTESAMREHFSTVYQLLDEMVDGGFPFTTEPTQLKAMIVPPTLSRKLLETMTGRFQVQDHLHGGTSRIPWRPPNLKYLKNEIYFDQIEHLDVIVGANEMLVSCEVFGDLRCTCKLSGMPDLMLSFNRPGSIDDASLHRCVRINKWKNERVLSFVPPDGKFKLLSYRVRNVSQLPIYVKPRITFTPGGARVHVMVGAKYIRDGTVDKLCILIPFPSAMISSNLTCNTGTIKPDAITKVVRWEIGRLPKDGTPLLEGTITLPHEFKTTSKPTIQAEFIVKSFCASGLSIENLTVRNARYKPRQGKRVVTKAGHYDIRCG